MGCSAQGLTRTCLPGPSSGSTGDAHHTPCHMGDGHEASRSVCPCNLVGMTWRYAAAPVPGRNYSTSSTQIEPQFISADTGYASEFTKRIRELSQGGCDSWADAETRVADRGTEQANQRWLQALVQRARHGGKPTTTTGNGLWAPRCRMPPNENGRVCQVGDSEMSRDVGRCRLSTAMSGSG